MPRLLKSIEVSAPQESSALAEAFGIYGSKSFSIVDVDFPEADLIFITGESGGGKSTLLSLLDGFVPASPPPDLLPILYGKDQGETMEVLARFGLSDARLFFTPFRHLSESQKERSKIVYAVLNSDGPLILDEFLSNLDRRTAKAVAMNVGRQLRRLGRKAVLASAHDDIAQFLAPDFVVACEAFPSRWTVKTTTPETIVPAFRYGTPKDWSSSPLADLHYRGKHTGGIKDVIIASVDGRDVGILVVTHRLGDGGRRISRLVVHPTYRGLGIGKSLVVDAMRRHSNLDVVAVMAEYNPVFGRAGMIPAGTSEISPNPQLTKTLATFGFDKKRWGDPTYCASFLSVPAHREAIASFPSLFSRHIAPGGKRLDPDGIRRKIIEDHATASRCLWWMRPKRLTKFKSP